MYLNDVCTIPTNLAGDAAMSVPFGTDDDGLPVGVQVLAPALGEVPMFRAAAVLEAPPPPAARPRKDTLMTDAPTVPTDSLGNPITVAESDDIAGGRGRPTAPAGSWSSASRSTPSWPPSPRCSRVRPTASATSPTPTSTRSPSGCPGTLPVVNEQAVELAAALRLRRGRHACSARSSAGRTTSTRTCRRTSRSPSTTSRSTSTATLELPSGHVVGIERAHLEEDTGKSTHVGGAGRIHGADHSLVDYNRAGVPLLEIVSAPDIRSADQARQYVTELRAILVAGGVSDGKMEEGSMRVDANVSVRPAGSDELGTRCEIKNVNSLRSLGRAIEYEARRQVDLLEAGERVAQETRHWDEDDGRTHTMRSKEEADDYRYFPEPDLVPVDLGAEWVDEIARRAAAAARRPPPPPGRGHRRAPHRPRRSWSIVERGQDDLALGRHAEAGADPARVLVHVDQNLAVDGGAELAPARLAELVAMEVGGELTATQAKTVLADLVADPAATAADIAAAKGFEAMDTGALEAIVDERHRRQPRRVGAVLRRRRQGAGQAHRLLRRQGHEGHQGPGRRQGRHRPPPLQAPLALRPPRSAD